MAVRSDQSHDLGFTAGQMGLLGVATIVLLFFVLATYLN